MDSDGIQDYTFYSSNSQIIIGFTSLTSFKVYLPAGDSNSNYSQSITAQIRDMYGAIRFYEIPIVITFKNHSDASSSSSYLEGLNNRATARDYLLKFPQNLPITTVDSVKLQGSAVTQLTQTTSELTRNGAVPSTKCTQLANALKQMAQLITCEDAQAAAKQIAQCTSNVHTANEIIINTDASISAIINVLACHMNIGQKTVVNTSSIITSLEKTTVNLLSNMTITPFSGSYVSLPQLFNISMNYTDSTPVTVSVSRRS
ncbi:unnamed protein product [Didymodactylos carnosus]|uniref:Uncharacterized protein n=1 Tax=Didymodactylos carnosus TaxID=1234261 RepID=A0A8S2NZ96_9BILA|nr:unnamed protein product [Didymodactylos carnosus]CAF4025066.1 unnamed protein product [Didymodactylos carnosus]